MEMFFGDDDKTKALEALKDETADLLVSGRKKIEKAKRRPVILDWIFEITDEEFNAIGAHFWAKGHQDLCNKMATIKITGPVAPPSDD